MKSFKHYINEGIITGRGGAADKRTILYPKLMREWCDKYASNSNIEDIIINNGKIDIIGDLVINEDVKDLNPPVPIDLLDGDLYCNKSHIKSLEGAPKSIQGSIYCMNCPNLESLEGAPKQIYTLDCSWCPKLTTLKGAPRRVYGDFVCCRGNLTSLEGSPIIVLGTFQISGCDGLKSLEGAPKTVGDLFLRDLKIDIRNPETLPSYKITAKTVFFATDYIIDENTLKDIKRVIRSEKYIGEFDFNGKRKTTVKK